MKTFKFKKGYALYILLTCVISSYGQGFEFNNDCGVWEKDTTITTEWNTIDTLNYNVRGDTCWVSSGWEYDMKSSTYLVYCPCGCGRGTKRFQKRVCGLGIIQQRWEITSYKYIPKPKSEFDKRVDSILNAR